MNAYNVDFAKMTITITADFAKKMNDPTSREYQTISQFLKDFPTMKIVNRTHRTPSKYVSKSTGQKSKCNPFKKLTYKNMENFINGLPNAEQYLKSYKFLKELPCRQDGEYQSGSAATPRKTGIQRKGTAGPSDENVQYVWRPRASRPFPLPKPNGRCCV